MEKLEITRTFNAPIDKVFNAWISPQAIMKWHSPDGYTTPFAFVDLKVHGTYKIVMKEVEENKTNIVLIHEFFTDKETKEAHNNGWVSVLNKLDTFLS